MWLYRLSFRHLYWSLAVLKKFFSLVPLPTLTVVALTLISQFSKLLAFFMPLKVIILIGSTGIPSYFPAAWAAYERDLLIVALSFTAILFYSLFLLSEKLLGMMTEKGAQGVVERSRKLVLFPQQDEVASQAYQKLAAGLATGILTVLLGSLFAAFYPAFLGVLVAYLLGASALVSLVTHWQPALKGRLQENTKPLIELLSGVGFLLLFAFMVADFLLWEGAGFMAAIISLLLSRQLLNRLESVIKDALWLHTRRLQINAIFFTGHKLAKNEESPRHKKLWEFLSLNEKPERLVPLLERVQGSPLLPESTVICRWRQSGLMDILAFDVELKTPGSERQDFLLKVFGSQHGKAALNEADLLLSSTGHALPAPRLLVVDQLDGYDVHLFRLPAKRENDPKQPSKRMARCWQVAPDEDLIARYSRSHPFLYQRLSSAMLERLSAAAPSQYDRIDQLASRFDAILAELHKLPLSVVISGVPPELSYTTDAEELQLVHWGSWSLEPVGSGFPLEKTWKQQLDQALESAAETRDALKDIPLDRIRLCVCLSHFEMRFNRQKYLDAMRLIPEMLGYLANLEATSGTTQAAISASGVNPASGMKDS